jgi:hypothetical protein
VALPGILPSPLAARHGIAETGLLRWARGFRLLLVPMILISGLLIDRLGIATVLLLGTLFAALALSWLALARDPRETGIAMLVLSVGSAAFVMSGCVLLPPAFSSWTSVTALNLGMLFFGFGVLLALRVTALILEWITPRRGLLILALTCLVPAFLALQVPHIDPALVPEDTSWTRLLGQPVFLLLLVSIMLAELVQGAVTSWTGHYLAEVGISVSSGEVILLFWWIMILAGRLLTALSLKPGFEAWCFLGLSLLAAVLIGNLIGTDYIVGSVIGLMLMAVCIGPIVPTLLGLVYDQVKDQGVGLAMGTAIALAAVGQVVFPPRFGPVATRASVRAWLRLPMILALVLAASLLTLALVRQMG